MLKVVGASWEKTRLTYTLLLVVIIIAVASIFFYELPSPQEDGMYAATVTWKEHVGFKVEFWGQNNNPSKIQQGVARAYYKPDVHTTGWASIEIETSGKYPDWVQAYGAGILEGCLCWQLIYWHWQNTVQSICAENEKACAEVRDYLRNVEEAARTHAVRAEKDEPFWHHVNLFYYQLDGLIHGWNMGVQRSRKNKQLEEILDTDFLWMNSINEIRDLKLSDGSQIAKQYPSLTFLKYLPNETHQFLLAHATGRSYSEMLRMHKKYAFGYHLTSSEGSAIAPGNSLIFTSYPGAIHSQDDNYQIYINNLFKLTVASTNIHKETTPLTTIMEQKEIKVPSGPQAVAACRLSNNASEWANIINEEGGVNIGGKQWIVIDNSAEKLSMWIVEQIPGQVMVSDETFVLREKGYWISAGTPYLKATLNSIKSNQIEPRLEAALEVLEGNHENVTTPEDLFNLMRKPELIALGRADIIQYKHKDATLRHGGIIDIKISDKSGDCLSVAGPPYSDEVSPFQWSRSIIQNLPHYGQPDLWQYGPVQPTWVW